ncbi:MAG: starch-binding protein [Bacteroidaceae bacterium]|nr:starch-binding protein [Bacteroidaceae bacterium]
MKKKLSLLMVALVAIAAFAVQATRRANPEPTVVLDFTVNDWGIPTSSKMVEENSYTNTAGYTIKLAGTSGNGYRYYSNGSYVINGQKGAYLTLPAFDFDVEKIEVVGRNAASADTKQNIFVGDTPVSTETTGVKGTNVYEIDEAYQAAGNVYVLKVTSAHNTQITRINIYKKIPVVKTVTFINDAEWTNVYAYTWTGEGNDKVEQRGAWPGQEIALTNDGYVLSFLAADAPENVIFHNNAGQQTGDLAFEDGAFYNSKGKLSDFSVTFNTDKGWEKVYAYAWTGETPIKQWPGKEITETLNDGVYTYSFKANEAPAKIIFNDGTMEGGVVGTNQTADLDFVNGKAYELMNPRTYTATFMTDYDWEKVYAYVWSGEEPDVQEFVGEWPGLELTKNENTGKYELSFVSEFTPKKIIFNNGYKGEDNQTADLTFVDGKDYAFMKVTWTVAGYPAALFGEGGTILDDNDMVKGENGLYIWMKKGVMLDAYSSINCYIYKDHDPNEGYYANADVSIEQSGIYNVTITYNPEKNEANVSCVQVYQYNSSFTTDQGWEKVYAYAWTGEEPNVQEYLGGWPGREITANYNSETEAYNLSFFALEAPAYIIFNNGLEGDALKKTEDLAFKNGQAYGLFKNVMLKGATEWTGTDTWTVMRNVDLTYVGKNTYTGILNLNDHKGDYQFKLFINDGNQDTWLGNAELVWDEKPDWITYVSRTPGSNFLLEYEKSEYRTYTVTATWNEDAEKPWTLKIEGKDLRSTPITLIDYPTSTDGITLNGNCYYGTTWVWDQQQQTNVEMPGILVGNGDNYITLATDGGFKAGDEIIVKAQPTTFTLYTLAEDNSVVDIHYFDMYNSNNGGNDRERHYILKKDYNKLYLLCPNGGDFLNGLIVERPYETPVIHRYTITGDFTDNEIEMTEYPYSMDYSIYNCTVKNVMVHLDEGQDYKQITFQAREDGEIIAEAKEFLEEGKYILNFTLSNMSHSWSLGMGATLQMAEIANVNLFGAWNQWAEGLTLTKGENNVYTGTLDLSETLDNQKFKLLINDGEQNYWLGSDVTIDDASKDLIVATGDKDNNLLLKNATSGYKTYTVTATWVENTEADKQWTLKIVGDEARPTNTYTINFKTNIPESKWSKVYAYLWSGEGEDKIEYVGGWPGKEINYEDSDPDGDRFSATFKAVKAPEYIIFSDGTTEGSVVGVNQSIDFAFVDAKQYTWNEYAVTFSTFKDWEKVFAYAWSEEDANVVKFSGEWPGNEITGTKENDIYTYAFQACDPEKIIFNDGTTDNPVLYVNKTIDLDFVNGKAYVPIVLSETATEAPEAANGVEVKVKRAIKAHSWSTICLPFAVPAEQLTMAFGEGVEVKDFTSWSATKSGNDVVSITVGFTPVTAMEANHPYVIRVKSEISADDGFLVDGVNIDPVATPKKEVGEEPNVGVFYGTYVANTTVPEYNLFISNDKFYYSNGSTKMKAFRGYFDLAEHLTISGDPNAHIIIIDENATGVTAIRHSDLLKNNVYDLQGRKVENPSKGLYIVNGKKVIVR